MSVDRNEYFESKKKKKYKKKYKKRVEFRKTPVDK
jgi:hypothetical protein